MVYLYAVEPLQVFQVFGAKLSGVGALKRAEAASIPITEL